jgi:beta-phosphoglucomutase
MKACIFDLDGVLVDTAKYHYLAWKTISDRFGFIFDEGMNERLKGVSRERSFEIIVENNNKEIEKFNVEDILEEKNSIYLNYINAIDHHELLPGAELLLKQCKKQNIYIALGSASKNAKLILTRTGIYDYFDVIVDGNDVKKAKPDPEVFQRACNILGLCGDDCIVFEDSTAGIQAAQKASMKTVGVGDKSILINADIVVNYLSEFDFAKFNHSKYK